MGTRKWLAAALCVLCIVSLAGCGGEAEPVAGMIAEAAATIENSAQTQEKQESAPKQTASGLTRRVYGNQEDKPLLSATGTPVSRTIDQRLLQDISYFSLWDGNYAERTIIGLCQKTCFSIRLNKLAPCEDDQTGKLVFNEEDAIVFAQILYGVTLTHDDFAASGMVDDETGKVFIELYCLERFFPTYKIQEFLDLGNGYYKIVCDASLEENEWQSADAWKETMILRENTLSPLGGWQMIAYERIDQ